MKKLALSFFILSFVGYSFAGDTDDKNKKRAKVKNLPSVEMEERTVKKPELTKKEFLEMYEKSKSVDVEKFKIKQK